MKIVITGRDFSACGQGIELLKKAGHQVTDYSEKAFGMGTDEQEIIRAVDDADAVIVGLEPYSEAVLEKCGNLKMISRRGIGYDNIDIEACRKRGIAVTRTAGVVEGAVAEQVMAYILYFSRRIDRQDQDMQNHIWRRVMMMGAKNHVLGLVGFGGIGKEIAKRAVPFGMKVIYFCRHPKPEWEKEYGVQYMALEELLSVSDFISVNVPLTEDTKGMFDKVCFSQMKFGSYFINIARAGVVREGDLRDALVNGHLAGAAIDVYEKEPCTDSVLFNLDQVVLTPHTSTYTEETFAQMNEMAAENVLDFAEQRIREECRLV